MRQPTTAGLVILMFTIPLILYASAEYLLAQLMLLSQLIVIWGLMPFVFRNERAAPQEWSGKILFLTLLVVGSIVAPFVFHLVERSQLQSTPIFESSARFLSESSEIFLILGVCLATIFIVASLVKRRGAES